MQKALWPNIDQMCEHLAKGAVTHQTVTPGSCCFKFPWDGFSDHVLCEWEAHIAMLASEFTV